MIRQSIFILVTLFALQVNAKIDIEKNPITAFIDNQIEYLELEQELFGIMTNKDILSINAINVYEVDEEITINWDTSKHLPANFDAREGLDDFDLNSIEVYEIEEEVEFNFDTKAYLPDGFNPYTSKPIEQIFCIY